tara:strand:+ start:50 stop:481 length:432 start_codon:yes stop_codon:yes gene_type:complete
MSDINMENISLKSLLTPSKTVEFEYPGIDGFLINVCYLSRESLLKLRNKCVSQKFNKKTRGFEEVLDDDKFLDEYTKAVIKGWKGLSYKYLDSLLLVSEDVKKKTGELPYTEENAVVLMQNSTDFDQWIAEITGDLENFTKSK